MQTPEITAYLKTYCGWSAGVRAVLAKYNLPYTEKDIIQNRKIPAHQPVRERFNEPIIVFLTVCSKDRKPVFTGADSVAVIIDAWQQARSWSVGRYVVMPDHVHLFCAPAVFPTQPLMQ